MPIYEYHCKKCNTIYQFLVNSSRKEEELECPNCHIKNLERVMSRFSTTSSKNSSNDDDLADLANIDENDPKAMARAVRRMADEMGEDLGDEMEHALGRLEAGEDPEKIEQELEQMGFGEDGNHVGGKTPSPKMDPGLY